MATLSSHRGFVVYHKCKFSVSWDVTTSVLAYELLLREVIYSAKYAKGRLLDVGCGKKPYFLIFSPKVESYIGIDLLSSGSSDAIDAFADICLLPFVKESFDTVLCSEVLEHVSDPFVAIREIHRVLKKVGVLILSCPQTYQLHDAPSDYYRFTKYGLIELVESQDGFRVEYCVPIGRTIDFAIDFLSKVLNSILNRKFISKYLRYLVVGILQRIYIWMRGNSIKGSERFALGNLLVARKIPHLPI